METNNAIRQKCPENLDEVVFDERNQNYGAYYLRRSYNKNVTRALFVAVLLFLGVISIPLIASYLNNERKIAIEDNSTTVNLKYPEKKDLEEVKLPEKQKIEKVLAFTAPRPVIDSIDVTDDLDGLKDQVKNDSVANTTGDIYVDEHDKDKEVINIEKVEPPVSIVQLMPTFTGGEDAMYKWLRDNIKYPQIAKESGIQGTVVVTFVVEKDGLITGVQILKEIGGGCGDEAVRVVKLMPKWREGRQNNLPVRVQFNLPIKYSLE